MPWLQGTFKFPYGSKFIDLFFLGFEYGWEGMTFPTTNMRVKTGTPGFFAKCGHLYPALETSRQRSARLAAQLHEFTCIRTIDRRDRAGAAEVTGPRCCEQAALLVIATTVVIAIKVFAFRSSWCFHSAIRELPQFLPAGGFDYTRVRYSPVRVSTLMVSPTFTKFGH